MIFFNLVLQTIEAFKAFTQAFIVSGGTGGPIDSTLFYSLYLYLEAFANFRMGYASALAWLLLVIIGIFTASAFLHLEILGLLRGRGTLDDFVSATKRTARSTPLIRHVLLIAAAFVMLYPLLWMIVSARSSPTNEIFSNPTAPARRSFDFSPTTSRAGTRSGSPSPPSTRTPSSSPALAVIGNLAACSLTAFAFARLEFRFKRLWFALMLAR